MKPPSSFAALAHVGDLGAVIGRTIKPAFARSVFRDRNFEARAEGDQRLIGEFLLLVRRIARLG